MVTVINRIKKYISSTTHIAPLAVFRVVFGGMMFASVMRFWLNGWIETQYILPKLFFPFYGFEWIKPLGETGMYVVFAAMAIAALFVMLGLFYRFSATAFFLLFTYVELIDKSNYLNHYYFVSIISLLLIPVPANRYFSLDVLLKPSLLVTQVPSWMVDIFKLQLGIVYFFAGIAKLNYDWLFRAMPLAIWLPAKSNLPLVGELLNYKFTAYVFSWFGAVYDILIPFFLFNKQTRNVAYVFVIVFHAATAIVLPVIGMFPYIMILATLIFFPPEFHNKLIQRVVELFSFGKKNLLNYRHDISFSFPRPLIGKVIIATLCMHFAVQLILPFRYLLYPGNLFWTEQGYRFSWRVMLMEKGGTAFFYVKDSVTGKESEVDNSTYLTYQQQKMMATQPDMILQFAHFLAAEYEKKGYANPQVRAESYVTLNGSGSKPFINGSVDLTKEKEGFTPKNWVLPFEETKMSYAER
ncbi:MAG: HTTM domain-containing protein [Bacteroidia bacterium]